MNKHALDAADIRILCAVQEHGRLSKAKLAEQVDLSPTPCWTRLTRLEKAGLVRGYHADIALGRIAHVSKVVVTVSLGQHRKSDFDRFERHVGTCDQIVECIATGGGMDYVLTVVTPDLPAFQQLMEELMAADLKIERYMTYIATREIKSTRPNIARLLDAPRPKPPGARAP